MNPTDGTVCFNSILVRLKVAADLSVANAEINCFNSILVRLKVAEMIRMSTLSAFQFHTGSIKRRGKVRSMR